MFRSINRKTRRGRPGFGVRLLVAALFSALLLSAGCAPFDFFHEPGHPHGHEHAALEGVHALPSPGGWEALQLLKTRGAA